jgi:2-(3-amino-3-carboxypropyl)histidine synthase
MDHMLIDAKYLGKQVMLSKEALKHIDENGYKAIALYAAVQFTQLLSVVIEQFESIGVKVISSKPMRANEKYQLLGCTSYKEALRLEKEPDAYLYIGDGAFHPRALVLAQREEKKFKEIIRFDPIQNKMTLMEKADCELIFKKYNASLTKFLMADKVGVLITVKPGQQQFKLAKKLRELFPDKKVYFFAEDTLDYSHLEDFNFIEAWVNSACPRIGFDDAVNTPASMINITDAIKLAKK